MKVETDIDSIAKTLILLSDDVCQDTQHWHFCFHNVIVCLTSN